MDDAAWDHSTFTKNGDRLLGGELARRFFALVPGQADPAGLLSNEHCSVDGAPIEALTSLKSCRTKDEEGPPGGGGRNPDVDFHGERRSRDTHESKTDKDALLFKKNKGIAQAVLPGPSADGETPRLGGRCPSHPGDRHCRAGGCHRHGRSARWPAQEPGSRWQRLARPSNTGANFSRSGRQPRNYGHFQQPAKGFALGFRDGADGVANRCSWVSIVVGAATWSVQIVSVQDNRSAKPLHYP